ncbi:hydrolase [Microbacterium barkeri]|uniref:Hydrolase n=1 Tax=Microbacterium barkeri TaxID=33917 RepID=A0A9W6H3C0_9MICO|nr:phytase [Microbacterium barkeri]MDR6875555.1 3-phytase [Microbacterium barkeri]GLJ61596.1 hydrolase [Microbacterium barkeri]
MLPRLLTVTAIGTAAVLVGASAAQARPHHDEPDELTAVLETPALWDEDDADADDPAIWIDEDDPEDSVVIATAKEAGIYVYDLDGEELQHIAPKPAPGDDHAPGRYNNVDIVEDFELDGDEVDLAVASDKGMDDLGIFVIDDGELTEVTDPDAGWVFSASQEEIDGEHSAYGLTTWQDDDGAYALVSRNSETEVALLELKAREDGTVGWERIRELALPAAFTLPDGSTWTTCDDPGEYAQVEGMVVDERTGTAYLGQELVGIWKVDADLTGEPELVDTAAEFGQPAVYDPETDECVAGENPGFGGDALRTDIEGLTIYRTKGKKGYLLASSQGDDTFAVYELQGGNDYVGSFAIGDGAVDGTQHSDGADAVSASLPGFDGGLLVVQDGDNTPEGSDEASTNFKFLAWEDVAERSGLDLDVARR